MPALREYRAVSRCGVRHLNPHTAPWERKVEWSQMSPVGTLEAEKCRLSELRGIDSQASITFDLRPWNRLPKLSDGAGVVGVEFE